MKTPTVLVAHHDPVTLDRLTVDLSDRGYHVLGPARTAAVALTLVAQAPVSFALVGERLAGRRHGSDLVRALRECWGVRSFLVRESPQAA